MDKQIRKLLSLIDEKYDFNKKYEEVVCNGEKRKIWNTPKMYIKQLKKEIKEVQAEMKNKNSVYLEDELGDIFWDFLNLAYLLKLEGKIETEENIFKRCEKKFKARVKGIKNGIRWEDIKKEQKRERKEEHLEKYGYKKEDIQKLYDENAQKYRENKEKDTYMKIHYKAFEKYIKKWDTLLDVGCAYGRDIEYFKDSWYSPFGIDISSEMRNLAKEEIKNLIITWDFFDIWKYFKNQKFDAIWSIASLVHIEKNDIEKIINIWKKVLKEESIIFVSVKEKKDDKDYKIKESISTTGVMKRYTYFSENELENIFKKHGFTKKESYKTWKNWEDSWVTSIFKRENLTIKKKKIP